MHPHENGQIGVGRASAAGLGHRDGEVQAVEFVHFFGGALTGGRGEGDVSYEGEVPGLGGGFMGAGGAEGGCVECVRAPRRGEGGVGEGGFPSGASKRPRNRSYVQGVKELLVLIG